MGEWTSQKRTLPTNNLNQPWQDQGGEGWLHLHRRCYQKWNPGHTGNRWPQASCWRRWLPCSRLWAGGNLGSNPSWASTHYHGCRDQDTRPQSPFAEGSWKTAPQQRQEQFLICFQRQFRRTHWFIICYSSKFEIAPLLRHNSKEKQSAVPGGAIC